MTFAIMYMQLFKCDCLNAVAFSSCFVLDIYICSCGVI